MRSGTTPDATIDHAAARRDVIVWALALIASVLFVALAVPVTGEAHASPPSACCGAARMTLFALIVAAFLAHPITALGRLLGCPPAISARWARPAVKPV